MTHFKYLFLGTGYLVFAILSFVTLEFFNPDFAPQHKLYLSVMILVLGYGHLYISLQRNLKNMTERYEKLVGASHALLKKLSHLEFETAHSEPVQASSQNSEPPKVELEDYEEFVGELVFAHELQEKIAATVEIDMEPISKENIQKAHLPMVLSQQVSTAVRENRIDIFAQPIVELPSRKRKFYELFSRLRTENNEHILPKEFLKIAQDQQLIARMDNLLLFRCIQMLKHNQTDKDSCYFINISHMTFIDQDFLSQFVDFLRKNKIIRKRIIFEFSQKDLNLMAEKYLKPLQKLQEMGFRFGMDQVTTFDFNYNLLEQLKIAFIKIPGSALQNLGKSEESLKEWSAFKAYLLQYKIEVVAERIELEQELVDILDFGIDYGQGYLFGEPSLNYKKL